MPPQPGSYLIDTGIADLVPDSANPAGWLLVINGLESSYVDLDDPTWLEFEYVAWMGAAIDLVAPPRRPIRALHLGGGGCTLPRYVAATRPGSRQVVFEIDAELLKMVTHAFRLDHVPDLRLTVGDGQAGLRAQPPASYDIVVRDAFDGGNVPAHLATPELIADVARVLTPRGLYLANVPAGADLAAAEAEGAVARKEFEHVVLVVDPAQLRGRRFGNVVLAASPVPLPAAELARRLSAAYAPARVVPVM